MSDMKDDRIRELESRVLELEDLLQKRHAVMVELTEERHEAYRHRDKAYDHGVREGMALVRQQADAWLDGRERTMALSCYTAALEAYEKGVGRE